MNEKEIIYLLLSKDERGMSELLTHYGPLMRYIISPILSNSQDREDCLSEAAMKVWKSIDRYDPERGNWKAWLTAVTRNHALNFKRSNTAHSTQELSQTTASAEPTPEELIINKQRQEALSRALSSLAYKDRNIFYRKYYYMQSTSQIALEMSMTERAVEGKLYRIKKQLRKMLGGEGYEH